MMMMETKEVHKEIPGRGHSTLIRHPSRDIIYEIGGQMEDFIEEICSSMKKYNYGYKLGNPGPRMKDARVEFGACVCLDYLYVVGGCEGERGMHVMNSVERLPLNPSGGKEIWERVDYMNCPRESPGLAVVSDKIFAIGGMGITPDRDPKGSSTTALASVEVFDPWLPITEDNWREVSPMKSPRGLCQTVVLNNKIYVIGGEIYSSLIPGDEELTRVLVNSVEVYDPFGDVWSSCKPCRHPRSCGVVVAQSNLIFAIGGEYESPSSNEFVEVYDPRIDEWSEISWPVGLDRKANLFSAIIIDN